MAAGFVLGSKGREFSYERRERVKDLVFREIALIMSEGNIKDTRVARAVITRVSMSRDMSSAKVFFTHLKGGSSEPMLEGLNKLSGFFRKQIALRLNLKKVPSIKFEPDEVLLSAHRVDDIIRRFDS
ncbi:MAG: 30S ribosome-binding factor RbfA [Candidatus Mycalebacterium zealandia]|nr:MAG: 30S ribosome-binding factor RbfA [Candidatus Mycalebacterium zealandia]